LTPRTTKQIRIAAALMLGAMALTGALFARPARAAHSRYSRGAGKAHKHLLVVTITMGFHHDSIPIAEETIRALGEQTGDWDTDFARTDQNASTDEKAAVLKEKMSPEALKRYDAVVFANTTGTLPLPNPQAFLDYIRAGHGFAAMHAGSDTFHQWPGQTSGVSAYVEMLGGEFLRHHQQCAVDGRLEDPHHPADAPLVKATRTDAPPPTDAELQAGHSVVDSKAWHVFDEIYLFTNNDRKNVHVLISMDRHPNNGDPDANQPGDYLLSWCKSYGKGRVFYTALGHRQEMWKDPLYQAHILGGLRFALGLARGSTKPGPMPAH
jgi:type 1 glutamine amidotransferase